MARTFRWDDYVVLFVLDKHSLLVFYSTSSPKQQSTGRHVSPRRHILMILSQPFWALMLSGEATNTNFIVFGLTQLGFEPIIYHTWGQPLHHQCVYKKKAFYDIMYTICILFQPCYTFVPAKDESHLWHFFLYNYQCLVGNISKPANRPWHHPWK
jgi:hypothetical protein